jgi:hypothetical protein
MRICHWAWRTRPTRLEALTAAGVSHITVYPMKDRFGFRARVWLVALSAALGLAAVWVLPPLRQWQEYHQFADQAPFLGIPNCLNVISNAAFVIVGLIGLGFLARNREANKPGGFVEASERWAYAVFFLGVILTGFSFVYYHWNPCDSTLVRDRLPVTVALMSISTGTITACLNVAGGLVPCSARGRWCRQCLLLAANREPLAVCWCNDTDMDWRAIHRCCVIPGGLNLTGAAQQADPELRHGEDTL